MMNRMSVAIDDSKWPKLTITVNRESTTGETFVSNKTVLWDQSYLQFEAELHNNLRPMVDEIIKRRKVAK